MWEELRSQVPRVLAFETLDFGSFWNWTEWNFIISGGQFYYQPCSMIKLCFKTWHFTLPWYSKPAQAWDFIFLGGILPGYSERCGGLVIFCCLFFLHPGTPRWFFPPNILTDEYSLPTSGSVAESCGVELEEVKAQTAKEVDLEQDGVLLFVQKDTKTTSSVNGFW